MPEGALGLLFIYWSTSMSNQNLKQTLYILPAQIRECPVSNQALFPYHLASEKRQKFFGHIRATDVLPEHHQVRVIRDKSYSALFRAAVLRNLVHTAPIEVTKGRCFAEKRRLVRKHYNV